MKTKRWVIVGATSAIAQAFAHTVAATGANLLLIARDVQELEIIANDCRLRHHIDCETLCIDLQQNISPLLGRLQNEQEELFVLLAASTIIVNASLDSQNIDTMLQVNALALSQIIHGYWQKKQSTHRLIFLSSVAACCGRNKNSLYGGSKALIETYLQGLQQQASKTQHLTIARLGFIDTVQTFGMKGIFYAAAPKDCAQACYRANLRGNRLIYFPFFWRPLMWIIGHVPFQLFRRVYTPRN